MNCNSCKYFEESTFDQSHCKKTGDRLCLTTDFKAYKEPRQIEINKENKDNLKVQSDWIYYIELATTSVGKNCPLRT